VDEDGVDAEACAGGEGFSGELEEDSFVHVWDKYRMGLAGGGAGLTGVSPGGLTVHFRAT
jgi:hypothetical protein